MYFNPFFSPLLHVYSGTLFLETVLNSLYVLINPLVTNDVFRRRSTLTQLSGNIPFKIGFFGIAKKCPKKWGRALCKAEAWRLWCGSWQNSRYGGPQAPLVPVPCRYLLVNCCSFFFPSQKGQILARFGETAKPACLWLSGRGPSFLSSLVRQPCCIVLEWYLVHVPSYGGIIWLKHEEIETSF